jgi:signal peptidase I
MSTAAAALETEPAPDPSSSYSRWRLTAGILGRTWLWFVAGCLIVTLVPVLFGWRPFVIESGSMEPRINVGDVILASPESDPQALLGRVTVFDDPGHPGETKSHRIVALNPDGTMTSKGDANPTVDSTPVKVSDVRGLGRLLVGFVGLPLIWAQTGQWLYLLLFLMSMIAAAQAMSRDREDDEEPDDGNDGDADVVPLPQRLGGTAGSTIAATTPLDPGLSRRARTPRWVVRSAYVALMASAISLPTASASFAATSKNTANAWAVGNWDYTAGVTALAPYLYWKLDETGTVTTVAADSSGNGRTGTYNPGATAANFTRGIAGALTTDTPNLAVTLTSATSCINTTSTTAVAAPAQLSEIVWFKSTSTTGGKILGFEQPRTGVAQAGSGGTYDRHIYMDGAGKVWFGVYNAGDSLISSPTALNDGQWHMAVGTLGTPGMKLYIDGTLVGTNPNTVGEATTGWWRAGCGNLAGWGDGWTGANNPTLTSAPAKNYPFTGSIDEVAIWTSVLTATQVRDLYIAK